MINHESSVSPPSPINNKSIFFLHNIVYTDWIFFFIFITKNENADGTFFSDFVNVSNFDWMFYVFKINSLSKIFISFCDSSWIMSAWFKYLTKHHLKHSLSSTFWILVSSIFWWTNSLSNFNNCLHLREYTLKYKYYDKRLNQQCSLKLFLKHFVYLI